MILPRRLILFILRCRLVLRRGLCHCRALIMREMRQGEPLSGRAESVGQWKWMRQMHEVGLWYFTKERAVDTANLSWPKCLPSSFRWHQSASCRQAAQWRRRLCDKCNSIALVHESNRGVDIRGMHRTKRETSLNRGISCYPPIVQNRNPTESGSERSRCAINHIR